MKTSIKLFTTCFLAAALTSSCGVSTGVTNGQDSEGYETGYGTISKDSNTHSISRVKTGDEITGYHSMRDYLDGRVAGLEVLPDGRLNIRGAKTRSGDIIEPLVIVDGVEVSNIDTINPSDVYSVDVLKDASASIYGLKGSGGVIVITTKGAHFVKQGAKDKKTKPTVTVETSVGAKLN